MNHLSPQTSISSQNSNSGSSNNNYNNPNTNKSSPKPPTPTSTFYVFPPQTTPIQFPIINDSQNSSSNNHERLNDSNRCKSHNNLLEIELTSNNINSKNNNNLKPSQQQSRATTPTAPIVSSNITSSTTISAHSANSLSKLKANLIRNFEKLEKYFNNNKKTSANTSQLNDNKGVFYKRNLSNCSLDSKLSFTNNFSVDTSNMNNNETILNEDERLRSLSFGEARHEQNLKNSNTNFSNHTGNRKNLASTSSTSITSHANKFNPNATAINQVKIIHSNISSNYYNDEETQVELNKKLALLNENDRIWLQQKGYFLLYEQVMAKSDELVNLQEKITALNNYLITENEQVRSTFEIELLKGEIRNLTNEKAKLELKISKVANWTCKKCTCSNPNELVVCNVCNSERDDDEILICIHCSTKNSLFNLSCTKCNSYFAADNNNNAICARTNNTFNSIVNEFASYSNEDNCHDNQIDINQQTLTPTSISSLNNLAANLNLNSSSNHPLTLNIRNDQNQATRIPNILISPTGSHHSDSSFSSNEQRSLSNQSSPRINQNNYLRNPPNSSQMPRQISPNNLNRIN